MVYKGELDPSELLCPIKYEFVGLNEVGWILSSDEFMLSQGQVQEDMDFQNQDLEVFVQNHIKLSINNKYFKIK